MRLTKQRQGMRDQLADALVSALTNANGNGGPPLPERKHTRGGPRKRSLLAGAALYAAGRRVLLRHGGPEPEGPDRRVRTRV